MAALATATSQVGSVEADLDGMYDHHIAAMIDDDEDADAIIARHEQQQQQVAVSSVPTSAFTSPVKAPPAAGGGISLERADGLTPTDAAALAHLVAAAATTASGLPALNPGDLADTPSRDLATEGVASGWGSRISGGVGGAASTPIANRTPTPGLFPFGQLSPQSVGRPGMTTPLRGAASTTAGTPLAGRALDVAAMLSNPAAYGLPALVNSPATMEQMLVEQRRQQLAILQLAELGFLGAGGFDPSCLTNANGMMMDAFGNGGGTTPGGGARRSPQFFDPYATSNTAAVDLIRGRVYEIAKDQHGCRYLQRLLDASSYEGHEASQIILVEITPHVAELMTDQYANFLVQKLFDIMPHDVRYQVAQIASPQITQIALTPHGTFSVQKLIETIATREEMEVIRAALARDVVRLVKDVHGNHVVQKVLQRFDHPDKQFIYDAMCQDCAAIATNKQGCCVLQRCLEFASTAQRLQLVASIIGCALMLIQDPFGNYVLQYVLEGNDTAVNDGLAALFLPHLATLCVNKFSSNVVEKMLRSATQTVRDAYVAQLKDPSTLLRLLQDDFGNYVIQTALSVASPAVAEGLVHAIRPHWASVRNAPYAKKLEAKMEMVIKKRGSSGFRAGGHSAGGFSPVHRGSPEPDGGTPTPVASPSHAPSSPPAGGSPGYRIRGGRRDI